MIRVLLFLAALIGGQAQAQCRLALALGLDVSGSVDSHEYRLQLDGLAAALEHPEVAEAVLALPALPIRLSIYEWSGPFDQHMLLEWTEIPDRATLNAVVARLRAATRREAEPGTALGAAMTKGVDLLLQQPDCWARTLDLSGDGKHNLGPHPRTVRGRLQRLDVTINALVIGADAAAFTDQRQVQIQELAAYFEAYVIQGADAFVETALGFEGFEDAMVRKLKRELQGPVLSRLRDSPGAL